MRSEPAVYGFLDSKGDLKWLPFEKLRGRHPADPTGEFFGEDHNPMPMPHEAVTYWVGIDKASLQFIGVGTYATVFHEAKQKGIASSNIVIGPLGKNHTFAAFEINELRTLHWNHTGGTDCSDIPYATMCAILNDLAQQLPVLETVEPTYHQPIGLTQRTRATRAVSHAPTSSHRASSGHVTAGQNKGVPGRPKTGTATGTVWDVADEIAFQYPNESRKSLKGKVIEKCKEKGINPATAQVQFGKWLLANQAPAQEAVLKNLETHGDNGQTVMDNAVIGSNDVDSIPSNPWA